LLENLKCRYQSQNKTKIFHIKNNFSKIILFFQNVKFLVFTFSKTNNSVNFFKNVFATFSKKQQFEDLFEKRFAGGICDLGGGC